MATDMEKRYLNLKNKFLLEIGDNCDIQGAKLYFQTYIDSLRALRSITTLSELIEILEERDILNCNCVMPLFYLGKDIFKNEKVTKFVSCYREHFLDGKDSDCTCGKKLTFSPPPLQTLQENGNYLSKPSNLDTDLKTAVSNIASNMVNGNWRRLSSELNISEDQIDLCYKMYPQDPQKQAYQMLMYWIENDKENATIEHLDKALNSRLCKKIGFGTHLRISCQNY